MLHFNSRSLAKIDINLAQGITIEQQMKEQKNMRIEDQKGKTRGYLVKRMLSGSIQARYRTKDVSLISTVTFYAKYNQRNEKFPFLRRWRRSNEEKPQRAPGALRVRFIRANNYHHVTLYIRIFFILSKIHIFVQ